jgi:hypothetical protein
MVIEVNGAVPEYQTSTGRIFFADGKYIIRFEIELFTSQDHVRIRVDQHELSEIVDRSGTPTGFSGLKANALCGTADLGIQRSRVLVHGHTSPIKVDNERAGSS